jgi:hypothetical protein
MTTSRSGLLAAVTLVAVSCSSGSPTSGAVISRLDLEVGESTTLLVSTHCGYEWLELDVNGQTWTTSELGSDSAGNPTEAAWPKGQGAELRLELIDATTLAVTAEGTAITHRYHPDPNPPGCD